MGPAALALPIAPQAWAAAPRTLSFYHTHTGERRVVEYYASGRYQPDALDELNRLLRDFRTGEAIEMDAKLFDLLYGVSLAVGRGTFEIVSGYRSPKTNAMLRQRSGGVAKKSLHMQGRAIDVRLSGRDTRRMRDAAIALRAGGVGYYARSNFVHLDTGRVRRW
ncbi:MAG: DUF882 domain-containing protein [Burkholderiales bacterium]|nr:MAG: DUF882 domain-containing protein [Burkholderiales bacterium]